MKHVNLNLIYFIWATLVNFQCRQMGQKVGSIIGYLLSKLHRDRVSEVMKFVSERFCEDKEIPCP